MKKMIVAMLIIPLLLAAGEKPGAVSLERIISDLNREHAKVDRDRIFASPSKPILFQLRARFELWNRTEKSEVRVYFEERGIDHPDWISGCIYEAWKLSHSGIEFDEDAFLKKQADIIRGHKEWNRAEEAEDALERDPYPPERQFSDPFAGGETEEVEDKNDSAVTRDLTPQSLTVMVRGIDFDELRARYLKPLESILKEEELGRIGREIADPLSRGKPVGFEIDLADFERGLPIVRRSIRDLAFPSGTEITYSRDGFFHKEYFKWHQRSVRVK